jgi:hypothetical protein
MSAHCLITSGTPAEYEFVFTTAPTHSPTTIHQPPTTINTGLRTGN